MMKMCGEKVRLVAAYRGTDTYDPATGTITPGKSSEMWQTCGKRPGHQGEHGGYGNRFRHWRFKVECWWRDR